MRVGLLFLIDLTAPTESYFASSRCLCFAPSLQSVVFNTFVPLNKKTTSLYPLALSSDAVYVAVNEEVEP